MSYVVALKTAIFVFPILAFFFTFPFILNQYHKYGSISKLRALIIYSFILYMITVYFLVILPLPDRSEVTHSAGVRLIPFSFVLDFIRETSFDITNPSTYLKALTEPCVYTVLFNIIMTVPFGIYLRYYFKFSFKKTLVYSFLLSLFFEITQLTGLYFIYPYSYRIFDVDDLIMNTLGGVLGYFISGFVLKVLPSRDEIDRRALTLGTEVSGFKRITLYFFDLFVFVIFLTIFNIFYRSVIIPFIIYYIIIPLIFDGKTLGGTFINVKLQFPKRRFLNLILRNIFLVIYYYLIPIGVMWLALFMNDYLNLGTFEILIFDGVCLILILIFYLINIIKVIRNRRIFYDDWFNVSYVSTIRALDDEKNYTD